MAASGSRPHHRVDDVRRSVAGVNAVRSSRAFEANFPIDRGSRHEQDPNPHAFGTLSPVSKAAPERTGP
jgi:hypothetical protein